jgi:hypothetical protein
MSSRRADTKPYLHALGFKAQSCRRSFPARSGHYDIPHAVTNKVTRNTPLACLYIWASRHLSVVLGRRSARTYRPLRGKRRRSGTAPRRPPPSAAQRWAQVGHSPRRRSCTLRVRTTSRPHRPCAWQAGFRWHVEASNSVSTPPRRAALLLVGWSSAARRRVRQPRTMRSGSSSRGA